MNDIIVKSIVDLDDWNWSLPNIVLKFCILFFIRIVLQNKNIYVWEFSVVKVLIFFVHLVKILIKNEK